MTLNLRTSPSSSSVFALTVVTVEPLFPLNTTDRPALSKGIVLKCGQSQASSRYAKLS